MGKKLIEKLQDAPLWHIVWVSVLVSELLTAVLVSIMSLLLHGKIRHDFLLTGAVTAGFVSAVITSLIVMFVTHIRQSQEETHAVRREVETRGNILTKARDYFTAITSHELRTPMAKLQLAQIMAEEMASQAPAADQRERLQQLLAELYAEMNRIVSATTLLTSLNTHTRKNQMVPLFLYPVLLYGLNTAREAINKAGRNITLTHDLKGIPEQTEVMAERELLSRVFEEILSNAVKYTPDGAAIAIAASLENGNAAITVADRGVGIPPEKTEQVFEPFFSFENPDYHSTGPYKYMGGGIGLGFTITRLIMEHHGGKIEIASPGENKGTKVTLTFPVLVKTGQ
ncbi:MAG: HAMP domain-containing histidine kinase [Nitrospinae bacterium]|nr:HAMP domain-containing histidine kinase [Nitrospinota bacterium]